MHHDQVGFTAGSVTWEVQHTQINQRDTHQQKTKTTRSSQQIQRAFDKTQQHPLMIKTLMEVGIEETYLNMIKTMTNP